MGFEDAVPPVPTREQELRFIERTEKSFSSQPWYKFYMNEALRTRKLHDVKLMNGQTLEYVRNFVLGSLVVGLLIVRPCVSYYQRFRDVPHVFRYRAIPFSEGYVTDRNRKIFKLWASLTTVGGVVYAARYPTSYYYDEYLTNKSVILESFD